MSDPWDAQFEDMLRPVLQHLPPGEPLRPDTDLAQAGLDSMGTVELLLSLEDHYSISLPDEMLQSSTFSTPESVWKAITAVRDQGAEA
ncbi:phosphopantetheine-binding protein [Streptomyces natalensis]|uniref:Carrier domain-containing protein n=1 Tax=Streptomyces natalensis ATCC 27448 TaxID=1240678 RepID=A0A0D7CJZ3_9ACTN|nr:phosphopantetheine-binding protein [Streptomyces natalensis]KIZ15727.1 hypothetical protein SNA_25000 [Streptomyces natalensis ATCC 27448]